MPEPTTNEIMEGVKAVREMVEANSFDAEKKAKIELVLDEHEDLQQATKKAANDLENAKADLAELKQSLDERGVKGDEMAKRLDEMEAEVARRGEGNKSDDWRDGEEYAALQDWCTKGGAELNAEQKALLRTDSAVAGGVLVPIEMDTEITKLITEIDGMRQVARVRTISSKSIELPIRATIPVATFEGEAEEGGDSTSTYQNETITPYRQTFTVPVTADQLMDSAFNMESEISGDAGEAFAFGEGQGFITGSGFKEPAGILNDAGLIAAKVVGGAITSSDAVFATQLVKLPGQIKVGYNPGYMFNRRTLAEIRSMRDTNGQFLWSPGMDGPGMNMLAGYPYVLSNSMDDRATVGGYTTAFGDFRRGYVIVDRTGMSVIRDDVTLKKKSIIEFCFNRWLTGRVVVTEAIRLLETTS